MKNSFMNSYTLFISLYFFKISGIGGTSSQAIDFNDLAAATQLASNCQLCH
jgi:hypothetical protein